MADYATLLRDHFDNVIVSPDDGVYTDIALEFGRVTNKRPIAFYPDKDTYYGIDHIKHNFPKYDLRPIDGDWYKLNADLTKQAPLTICVGVSPGVLIEVSYIKYHQKYGGYKDPSLRDLRLLIDERSIERRLPSILEEQIQNLNYFRGFDELNQLLRYPH